MAKKIGIVNLKGGVGKTTTAICLTDALNQVGIKTLLVDFDSQGNSSLVFEAKENEKNIYDCLLKDLDPKEAIVTGYPMGDIIPANSRLANAALELASMTAREVKLKKVLKKLEDDYEVIVIDSSPAGGIMLSNVLTAVDGVIIPMEAETFSLAGFGDLLGVIGDIQENTNENLEIYGVLLTNYDKKKAIQVNISKQISELEELGLHTFKTFIRDSAAIPTTQGHFSIDEPSTLQEKRVKESKGSVFCYGKNNGAEDYASFTAELLEVIE